MRRLMWLVLLAASAYPAAPARAASACLPTECYSAKQVRTDLSFLYATMRDSHFNLYARVPQAAYDAYLASLLSEISGAIPKGQANLLMQRLLAFGRVGHARTDAPVNDALAFVHNGGKILPINVRIVDDRMVLKEQADPAGKLKPGSEILAIDGIAVADLFRRLRTIVSADTDRLLHAQVEEALPIYLYLLFGPVDVANIEARVPGQEASKTFRVAAVDLATMKRLHAAHPVAVPTFDPAKREFRILDGRIAYLRPGPFANVAGEPVASGESYDPAPFEAFLAQAFEAFETAGSSDLIIDLRANSGGDNSFSDLMLARIADKPFRFASRFRVKASAATKEQYSNETVLPNTLMATMVAAERAAPNGSTYSIDLPMVQPRTTNRFNGRVWALIDRHSYSNAAVVAATIQDYRFGTLMGEATADLATTFGSIEHFKLPGSGISIAYPKSYMVRPSGDERVEGVRPDIAVPLQPIDDAMDRVLEAAIARAKAAGQFGHNNLPHR